MDNDPDFEEGDVIAQSDELIVRRRVLVNGIWNYELERADGERFENLSNCRSSIYTVKLQEFEMRERGYIKVPSAEKLERIEAAVRVLASEAGSKRAMNLLNKEIEDE